MKLHKTIRVLCIAILTAAVAVMCSGCIPHKELKELWIVQGIAIDGDSQKGYNLTYQALKSSSGGGGGMGGGGSGGSEESQTFKSSGSTVFSAFRNTTLQTGKKLYFSNNLVVILSEQLCKEDIGRVLDVFQRDPDFQPDANVYVVKKDPDKVLTGEINGMSLSAKDISDISKNYMQSSKTIDVTLSDLFLTMDTKYTDPIVPVITLNPESSGKESSSGGGSGSGGSSGSEEKSVLQMDGAAVYHQDKLAGYLSPSETRGYLWVTGKPVKGVVVIEPQKGLKVSCEVTNNSSKITPSIESGKPKIKVVIKLGVNISEVMGGAPNIVYQLKQQGEASLDQTVRSEAEAAVKKALKEDSSDVFGFGMMLYRKYPNYWKKVAPEWSTKSKDTEVSIQVESNFNTVGQITK